MSVNLLSHTPTINQGIFVPEQSPINWNLNTKVAHHKTKKYTWKRQNVPMITCNFAHNTANGLLFFRWKTNIFTDIHLLIYKTLQIRGRIIIIFRALNTSFIKNNLLNTERLACVWLSLTYVGNKWRNNRHNYTSFHGRRVKCLTGLLNICLN